VDRTTNRNLTLSNLKNVKPSIPDPQRELLRIWHDRIRMVTSTRWTDVGESPSTCKEVGMGRTKLKALLLGVYA